LAGLLIAARLGSGSSNAAVGFELQVIAAVVLGGTSLMGGAAHPRHRARDLTIAVIGNGLILMHISPFFTQIVTGDDHPASPSGSTRGSFSAASALAGERARR
jgi:simple sugar transport system permease protein